MRTPGLRLYVGGIALLAVGTGAALVAVVDGPLWERPALAGIVALLIALEHEFATRVAFGRRDGETTTHEEAYIVFLALVEPSTAAVAAVVLGFALGGLIARRQPVKGVFNVASMGAAAATAMLVTQALGGGSGDPAPAVAAVLAGLGVYFVLNRVFLSGVLAIVGAAPFRETLRDDLGLHVLVLAANAAIGSLAGLAARDSLAVLPLALVALVVIHFSLAGHGRARAEREKLREIVNASTDGIVVVDDDRKVVGWSTACAEITGYAAADVVDRQLHEVFALLELTEDESQQRERQPRYESRMRTKAGELRWVVVSHAPLPEGGEILVLHDDTARRAVEELKAAQINERTRADLVASVSHEFRTPLTSIIGFTETLLNRPADDEQRERYLRIVNEQALRLEHLVQDLLDLGATDVNALQLKYEPVDLADLVRREVAALHAHPPTHRVEIAGDPSPPLVRADARRIEQVVANLLSNAMKYSPPGSPVTATLAASDSYVSVAVRDEGVGIPPEHHDDVFTPFFRTGETEAVGTGLGLAIARQIILLHGGSMSLRSAPGEGSEFSFSLPIAADGPPD